MHHERHSAFPIAVAALTVALASAFTYAALRERPAPPSGSAFAPAAADYRAGLVRVLSDYAAQDAAASTDLARLAAAEAALGALLSLEVPEGERDTHLAVAVALNQVRAGLRGEGGMEAKGRAALEAAKAGAPWLK